MKRLVSQGIVTLFSVTPFALGLVVTAACAQPSGTGGLSPALVTRPAAAQPAVRPVPRPFIQVRDERTRYTVTIERRGDAHAKRRNPPVEHNLGTQATGAAPVSPARPLPVPGPQVVLPPIQQGAPTPISDHRCTGQIEADIEQIFGPAGPWMSSVVWRESNCIPTARNGSSGSEGLTQLFRHDDLLAAVCPQFSPSVSWSIPECNLLAAKRLYDADGVRPWAL
jgi:hypothetical protein